MLPPEKRLQNLKEMLQVEQSLKNPNQNFIEDLKLSIRQCKRDLESKGYQMVEI